MEVTGIWVGAVVVGSAVVGERVGAKVRWPQSFKDGVNESFVALHLMKDC